MTKSVTKSQAAKRMGMPTKMPFRLALSRYWGLYVIVGVIMAYYLLFYYWPIVMGVMMAFKEVKLGMSVFNAPWVGVENFDYIFHDSEILRVTKNTLILSVLRLFWTFWPPIVLAIMIFDLTSAKYKRVCQTFVYIPHFFSWVIMYGIVFAFFSGNGMINNIIAALGGRKQDFLMNSGLFRSLLVGSQVWKGTGWGTILYFAALTNVNPELYEAAKIDGANDREILFKIKIPMVMPSVTICTFLTLTNSFKLFDQNVALTAGEPANASEMLALNIYNTFYGRSGAQWKGIGQAKAVVFFLIVVVISLAQLHFTRSKEVQQ